MLLAVSCERSFNNFTGCWANFVDVNTLLFCHDLFSEFSMFHKSLACVHKCNLQKIHAIFTGVAVNLIWFEATTMKINLGPTTSKQFWITFSHLLYHFQFYETEKLFFFCPFG